MTIDEIYAAKGPIPAKSLKVTAMADFPQQLMAKVEGDYPLPEALMQLRAIVPKNFQPDELPELIIIGYDDVGRSWIENNPFPDTVLDVADSTKVEEAISDSRRPHGEAVRLEIIDPWVDKSPVIAVFERVRDGDVPTEDWALKFIQARSDEYMAILGELRENGDLDLLPEADTAERIEFLEGFIGLTIRRIPIRYTVFLT